MSSTTKGVPFPAATDSDNVPGDIQALATWVDTRPGIAAMTTTARNALVAPDLWAGRIIFNITTGQLEQNTSGTPGSANWAPAEVAITPWADYAATAASASPSTGACTILSARFKQVGKTVFFTITFQLNTSSQTGTFMVPVAVAHTSCFATDWSSGVAVINSGTTATYNLGVTASTGQQVTVSGTYEAA